MKEKGGDTATHDSRPPVALFHAVPQGRPEGRSETRVTMPSESAWQDDRIWVYSQLSTINGQPHLVRGDVHDFYA
jgi:hypothetical protein